MSEQNRRLCVFSFLFIYMLCSLAQAALAYFIRAELGVVHFVLQLISGILCFSSGLNRMMTVTSLSDEGTSQVHCDTAGLWLAFTLELLVLVLLVLDRLGLLWHVVALGSQDISSQILAKLRPSDNFTW
ncbi:uncharacterized protein LOC125178913 [Hyalella azteca]|uniref:Uncharacterized protein LOC125178913 n=1 Tax=Hyalella azteca TaxID=294128 RepID=A0A979FSZ8_HYAAZ|nr:uncharacterized protein LOC125178913 [Hyalella azteca]